MLMAASFLAAACGEDTHADPTAPPAIALDSESGIYSVKAGRTLRLAPVVTRAVNPSYRWTTTADGTELGRTAVYEFTAADAGQYYLTFTVAADNGTAAKDLRIDVAAGGCTAPESAYYRPKTAASAAACNRVYEFLPAPGQFVNEGYAAATADEAAAYAESRLAAGAYVSLGGFGGYVTVGFDHSIDNATGGDGYDFAVRGNAFEGSSEPGIVWVMQDADGDGLPNDTWYELKGSEAGNAATRRQYAVTYYRPAGNRQHVAWTDSDGNAGTVDVNNYHTQPSYYPQWVAAGSYTLHGTALAPRNEPVTVNPEYWLNRAYDWGYADNFGADLDLHLAATGVGGYTGFKIENAVNPDGSPAALLYIDFVKVQTGVNAKSGWMGELSTEVMGVMDLK
jgi:hypothetical protein